MLNEIKRPKLTNIDPLAETETDPPPLLTPLNLDTEIAAALKQSHLTV